MINKTNKKTESDQCSLQSITQEVRCSNCKHLKHEVRLGNPNGDIVECTQESNKNTSINNRNIYEEWHCDVFEPCE